MDWKNTLYFGDNLQVLRANVPSESVDLIYLDPPFNSNANYNVLFAEKSGEKSAAQIHAFEDTWGWGLESEAAYNELVTQGPKKLADLMQALLSFLGRNDMMAYLVMMAIRLVELHRVLKPTGSIYLHCDPTSSHYLKLVLDAVFGPMNFLNELIWKRTSARSDSHRWNHIHDVIFFYSRTNRFTWNTQFTEYGDEYVKKFYRFVEPGTGRAFASDNLTAAGTREGSSGRPWHGINVKAKGIHWKYTIEGLEKLDREGRIIWPNRAEGVPRYKRYLDEMPGLAIQSIVSDIAPLSAQSAEKLGYPTQKPEALLERIIKASSNEGAIVLDPFCGCGTAIAVAERLKRRWIGIDITYLAINLVQRRLRDTFVAELSPYQIIGAPKDLAGAEELKRIDPYQFEWWAVDLVDARPAHDRKKGADSGVDGYINFLDDKSGVAKKVVVQVKSGYVGVNHVRDLKGVLEREKAAIGALITLREPTGPMKTEAASTGFYQSENFPEQYPRLQILTIADLLGGKQLLYPRHRVETFKKAERKSKDAARQSGLF
ncbi:MAG TPA: DNA methyltransferase [Terriglobia bacterium]|nr:DNA methyltransferase [Terriglobia bacterium]